MTDQKAPRILVLDIETAPILGYAWKIWEENIGLNQIVKDWYILSWAAKWLGDPPDKIMYQDLRRAKAGTEDRSILKGIWRLLDKADIILTQNGKAFDAKKLNARFIMNGMKPPSSYKHLDTKLIAKRLFGFTSNRLEYMTEKLCTKNKKQKSQKYVGFDLWKACLSGDQEAWKEMERYNKHDVLSLEELYEKLRAWDNAGPNVNLYTDESTPMLCKCGSNQWMRYGYAYTGQGKFQRYRCKRCGAETRSRINLLSKEKKLSLRVGIK